MKETKWENENSSNDDKYLLKKFNLTKNNSQQTTAKTRNPCVNLWDTLHLAISTRQCVSSETKIFIILFVNVLIVDSIILKMKMLEDILPKLPLYSKVEHIILIKMYTILASQISKFKMCNKRQKKFLPLSVAPCSSWTPSWLLVPVPDFPCRPLSPCLYPSPSPCFPCFLFRPFQPSISAFPLHPCRGLYRWFRFWKITFC